MRRFSLKPTFTLAGRTFKGLRGWSGKPLHPPLTDFPIAAYILAAILDIVATVGRDESWAQDFFHAATYVFVAGAAVSVLTALTGFWDWLRSTEAGTQARRTANAHALAMVLVTLLALTNIVLRIADYDSRVYPSTLVLVLSVVIAVLVALGAALGGTLVFDYGFNVETASDSPVWHPSERDVLPGEHE
jgi:uncharacterized membrane protein